MFQVERGFCNENCMNEDVIIDLTDTNAKEAPNLDDLEIGMNNSQEIGAVEEDEHILHVRILRKHK